MAFEKFTKGRRGNKPTLSIRKNGQFGFNFGAVDQFALSGYGHVLLFFDTERQLIGIKPIKEPEEFSLKLIVKKDNGTIGAKSFLDYYKIPYGGEVKKYTIRSDEEDESLLVVSL